MHHTPQVNRYNILHKGRGWTFFFNAVGVVVYKHIQTLQVPGKEIGLYKVGLIVAVEWVDACPTDGQ